MQSAIFNTATVVRTIDTEMRITSSLAPFDQQVKLVNDSVFKEMYGSTWLTQQTRSFTTFQHAILPFQPLSEFANQTEEIWSADVQAYSTSLDCKTAKSTFRKVNGVAKYEFDNQDGCKFNYTYLGSASAEPGEDKYIFEYIGYYSYFADGRLDTGIPGKTDGQGLEKARGCSDTKNSNTFFAVALLDSNMNNETMEMKDFTALFCVPKYYVETMTTIVNASSQAIINQTSITERVEVPGDVFNTTHIARLISSSSPLGGDSTGFAQDAQTVRLGFAIPMSSAASYAVALSQSSIPDFMTTSGLSQGLEKMHKLVFTQAFSFMTLPVLDGSTIKGARKDTPGAIVLVRTFSIIVETVLAVVVLMTVGLWYLTFRRTSKLPGDPSVCKFLFPDDDMPFRSLQLFCTLFSLPITNSKIL